MTGAGAPGGPGIIKGIQKDSNIDLIVADFNPEASGKFLNDKFEQVLSADDPEFIPDLLKICIKNQIDIVFPLVTKELFKLSKEKKIFSDH